MRLVKSHSMLGREEGKKEGGRDIPSKKKSSIYLMFIKLKEIGMYQEQIHKKIQ